MSALDRDKARDVLGTWMRGNPDSMSNEEFLDRLEECVQPDPNGDASTWRQAVAAATGWIVPETGEIAPAGVVIADYQQASMWAADTLEAGERARIAEAKLARIAALCTRDQLPPAKSEIRAILEDGAA